MSSIVQQYLNGEGFPDTLVIDGHIHIGEWPHNTTFRSVDEAVDKSVEFLDANGVDAFCSMSGGYVFVGATDYRLGNDFLLEVWQRIPDRMVPFMSLNPNDTRENILAELNRMYEAGVRCIKLINYYQESYPGDGPNLMAVYEYAAEHRMLVFNHTWEPDVIEKIAERFTEMDFILGHYYYLGQLDPVLKTHPNVYTNIWVIGPLGWLDRGIKNVGAHKFILGSDGFLNQLSLGLGPVVFAPISDDEKRLILGITMAHLLDKVGALPDCIRQSNDI